VVGAPYTSSGFSNSGAVYIFETQDSRWQQVERLATGRGGAVQSDLFGWSVALDRDMLVIGAYLGDAVHVYNRIDSGWQQTALLRGADTQSRDRFGFAVATDGNRIVIGAAHDSDTGNNAGTAYIFAQVNGIWNQEAKLTPTRPTPVHGTNFGWSVAINGDTAAVGAVNSKGVIDAEASGAVYTYQFANDNWREIALQTASDASPLDQLGSAVALGSNSILAGAPHRDASVGTVYVFDL
jgi:hypothetical protein